jgi:hypothetical protein
MLIDDVLSHLPGSKGGIYVDEGGPSWKADLLSNIYYVSLATKTFCICSGPMSSIADAKFKDHNTTKKDL